MNYVCGTCADIYTDDIALMTLANGKYLCGYCYYGTDRKWTEEWV